MSEASIWDVVVVGGGPAGLSAGMWLGRCRRKVVVVDAGEPRNLRSHGVRGYLTRDGILPLDLLALGRSELRRYRVPYWKDRVTAVQRGETSFAVTLRSGKKLRARKLVLATGLRDHLPAIEGVAERYGTSVHHCPYCDGFEHADRPLAVYARGNAGFAVARKLLDWSHDVTLLTDGASRLSPRQLTELELLGIAVDSRRIQRLEGPGQKLTRVRFADGDAVACRALFFSLGFDQRSGLAEGLGCRFTDSGCVITGRRGESGVAGVFVVGDASRDTQMAIVAAAEGARAAVKVHEELQAEDRRRLLATARRVNARKSQP
jgi:thioredoxin reductase